MELDDGEQGVGDDQKMIKCFTFAKEEREKQKPKRSRQRYKIGFCFGDQDTIESVITFSVTPLVFQPCLAPRLRSTKNNLCKKTKYNLCIVLI